MLGNRDLIKDKEVVVEGFKIFNYDFTAQGNYSFEDKDGNIEGTVHYVNPPLQLCGNGFHFSENPLDCSGYYPMVQWNKFAKIKAYGAIQRDSAGTKTAAEIIEIVKILSFDEFIEEIKTFMKDGLMNSDGISYGYGIRNGYGISYGSGIRNGSGIESSKGVATSTFCKDCEGISRCICCINYTGKLAIFNKSVSENRYCKIDNDIDGIMDSAEWRPDFTNAKTLKGDKDWKETPASSIAGVDAKEAYKDMPQELIDYIKGLEEYDEAIFNAITGRE